MSGAKEKPASGGNHLAGLSTQNANVILPVLAMLERISIALEKSNEVLARQNKSLDSIGDALHHLNDA